MSITTDLAAIKIVANTAGDRPLSTVLQEALHTLVCEVPYIHHASLYLEDEDVPYAAFPEETTRFDSAYTGVLSFPLLRDGQQERGKLVVATKEMIAFDVTDLSTLQTVADRVGKRLFAH